MTCSISRRSGLLAAAVALPVVLAWFSTAADAAVVIEESFNYTVGEDINGKNGGTGFNGAWAFTNGGDTSANAPFATGTVVNGLSFGSLVTSGGALQLTNRTSTGANASSANRQVAVNGPGDSIWSSYLVRMAQTPPVIGTVLDARYRNGSATGTTILRNGAVQNNATNNPGVAISGAGTAAATGLAADTTYLMIANFTGSSTNSYTNATMWVLTETGFANFLAGGGTLAALNANAFATATNSGSAVSIDANSDYFDFFNFAGNVSTQTSVIYDEYRLGTALSDVVPVPEPASLALIGIGGALVLGRRRQS